MHPVISFTLSSKRIFFPALCLTALAVLALLAAFNFTNDRWGVYSEDRLHFVADIQVNRFALKTWHVLDNPELYDCLIMGSSRVDMIDTRRFPGTCYNFTHSGGTPSDHLIALRQFTRAGIKFKAVYLGLDEFSYIQDPDVGKTQKMRRPPPDDFLDWVSFHASYLLHFPEYRDWEVFNGHAPRITNDWYVISPQNHQPQLRHQARRKFLNASQHKKVFETVQATYWGEGDYVSKAVADLSEIVALSEQHSFDLTLFFNPLHYTTYLQQDLGRMERFLAGVVQVAPVLDFAGLNAFTLDSRYWLESSHYTTRLGDKMIPYLLDRKVLELPFGQVLSAGDLKQKLRSKYWRDIAVLYRAEKFKGAHFIPRQLADVLIERASAGTSEEFVDLKNVERRGDYYVIDEVGASVFVAPSCSDAGLAQRPHLISIDLEYRAHDELYLYSPDQRGEFSGRRRQRLYLPAGRQKPAIFMRAMACDSMARIIPFAGRGTFKLNEMLGYQLPPFSAWVN
ncbi:MAG: hypothetical protein V7696_06435 [Halioglobus sp.]